MSVYVFSPVNYCAVASSQAREILYAMHRFQGVQWIKALDPPVQFLVWDPEAWHGRDGKKSLDSLEQGCPTGGLRATCGPGGIKPQPLDSPLGIASSISPAASEA